MYGARNADIKTTPFRGRSLRQSDALVVDKEHEAFAEPCCDFRWDFIGLRPACYKEVIVEVFIGDVVYCEYVTCELKFYMVDFALTDLNVVVTFAMDAMFAEFDFVGKDKSSVDDVVDFLAIAMVCDSVADYLDICVAKRAIVAIKGPQETAGDTCAVFGVILFATNHSTVVQEASNICKYDLVMVAACATCEIFGDSGNAEPVLDAVIATKLRIFFGGIGANGLCPNTPFCVVIDMIVKLIEEHHKNPSILNLPFLRCDYYFGSSNLVSLRNREKLRFANLAALAGAL